MNVSRRRSLFFTQQVISQRQSSITVTQGTAVRSGITVIGDCKTLTRLLAAVPSDAYAGPVDSLNGKVISMPNCPGWEEFASGDYFNGKLVCHYWSIDPEAFVV
jgi:hypothetical protein